MRNAFSEAIVRLATRDPRVLLLTGDHGYALFDEFRKRCPGQYINAGIAEQNMVGMAAGLARGGFRPIVYGLSAFIPIRVLEQIKLDVAHDDLPVIFIGDGAGFVYSHLGTSHQSTEDIACARVVPNLAVCSPADRFEMTMCIEAAYERSSAVYLRIGKSDRGDVHSKEPQARPGELLRVRGGVEGGLALVATGSMVRAAIDVAEEFLPEASVWSVPWIKPTETKQIVAICDDSRGVAVLKEHSVFGGLGSMVAEIAAESAATRVLRIGVADRFSEHCGSYEYLLREHRLDHRSVAERLLAFTHAL